MRAPADGTVLNMIGKAGETAVPSPESALLVFGDLSGLRVRAEVEERDAAKISVARRSSSRPMLSPTSRLKARSRRSRSRSARRVSQREVRAVPNDVEVVEVMVSLDGNPPLFTGMRVDTFFKADSAVGSASACRRLHRRPTKPNSIL